MSSVKRTQSAIGTDLRLRTVVLTAFAAVWVAAIPVIGLAWYAAVVAGVVLVMVVGLVTIRGFTVAQWTIRRAAAIGGVRCADPAPAAVKTMVADREVGVLWHHGQLICALDVHGRPHVPHWLRQRRVTTTATLPLDVIEDALAALGDAAPHSVDLTFDATRLAAGGDGYTVTYDAQLAGRPVSGRRTTTLIARFAPAQRALHYAARESLTAAAAASVVRIAASLGQAGCPATALSAGELNALAVRTQTSGRARWRHIATGHAPAQAEVVYAIEPAGLSDSKFAELWGVRCDWLLATLRRDEHGKWTGYVRIRTPRPPASPPLPFLTTLPGQQRAAATLGRPIGSASLPRTSHDAVASLSGLNPPVGSDGQVIGMSDSGELLMLPLIPGDGSGVAAAIDDVHAEQLIARAAATGAKVTIMTERPQRWAQLVGGSVQVIPGYGEPPRGRDQLHVYDAITPPPAADNAWLWIGLPNAAPPPAAVLLDGAGPVITVTTKTGTDQVRSVIDPAEVTYLPSARSARTPSMAVSS